MKKTVLITGTTSGIGFACAKKFLESGDSVVGISRNRNEKLIHFQQFTEVIADLSDVTRAVEIFKRIHDRLCPDIIISNAGIGYFGPHESIKTDSLIEMVGLNLTIPLILTEVFLRDIKLKQGTLVYISSVSAKKPSPVGAAYSATKAGISQFANSLFEEIRKTGVRVLTIYPDIANTGFYKHSDFEGFDSVETRLEPNLIADVIFQSLRIPSGSVISELTIRPQKNRIMKKLTKLKL